MLNKLCKDVFLKIDKLNNDFVKLYTFGKEKNYLGTSIEYYDDTNTFMFFYYSSFVRVYVINGVKEERNLVQVNKKINVISVYDDIYAKRFIRFYKEINQDPFFVKIPPLFFREINVFLGQKKYMEKISRLYLKYKENINNGMYYPDC